MDFGNGNDFLQADAGLRGGALGSTHVDMGNGNDVVKIGQLGVGAYSAMIDLGAGDDVLTLGGVIHGSRSYIDGGQGHDTLNITASNTNHSLSQIRNIETIDVSGAKNYELNITAKDLFSDAAHDLYIKGATNGGNVKVDLGNNGYNLHDNSVSGSAGAWVNTGVTEVDGVSYNTYTHSSMNHETVFIEQGIQVI